MNVLIAINKAYIVAAEVMIGSLARKTEEQIDVYLLNASLSQEEIALLGKNLKQNKNVALHSIEIDASFLDELPLIHWFSKEIYYRLIAQFVLPQDMDRIVWIDADTIILNDLTEFYYQDFEDAYIIACPDKCTDTAYGAMLKKNLGLPEEYKYFNSGVIVFNLPLLRRETKIEDIKACAYSLKEKLKYPDQDILNVFYKDKVKYAEPYYNWQVRHGNKVTEAEKRNIRILHFVGHRKPWRIKYSGKHAFLWWKEARKNRGGGHSCGFLLWWIASLPYRILYRPAVALMRLFPSKNDK